jgi:glyceraldehyde-3-phosphate dehydrogenase (NADP+)
MNTPAKTALGTPAPDRVVLLPIPAALVPPTQKIPSVFALNQLTEIRSYLSGGRLVPHEGALFEVTTPLEVSGDEPDRQKVIGHYPALSKAQALGVLESATRAWDMGCGLWPSLSQEERCAATEKFLAALVTRRCEIVGLLIHEIGKSVPDAEKEFDRTIAYLKETIAEVKSTSSSAREPITRDGIIARVERSPAGVALCMGPSNYPFNETLTVAIPSILMGNPTIMKPAKYGVLLFKAVQEALQECFPAGVANVVYGDGREIITPLLESGSIDLLAFIGSSGVASKLTKLHPAPHRLKLLLGLGAKNPAVVLPDANIPQAAKECVDGALTFNGQRCTALKVLYVHESIADEFAEAVSKEVNQRLRGMPWEQGVSFTPLYESGKAAYLRELIDDAGMKGARVINDGGGIAEGTSFQPAVLYPVTSAMRVYSEEQFGPIVPIVKFSETKEIVDALKTSAFGQQVSLFGADPQALSRLARGLQNLTSRININSQCQRGPDTLPFAGRKDSALGTVSIKDTINFFSTESVVAGKLNSLNGSVVWPELLEKAA